MLETVKEQLKTLRLATARLEIEDVLARHKKAASLPWVTELLNREIDARKESSLRARLKTARFPVATTLESFDFAFNPQVDEEGIRELATLKFIDDNRMALFLGPPGTGKTHLGIAIGVLAVRAGHRVFWSSAKRLGAMILEAKVRNTMDELYRKILQARLWIIDDWGIISMRREVAEEVFDLMDRRKYASAMILTSNRDIDEWPLIFPDTVLANSTIDRLFEEAKICLFKGPSYRLKGRISAKEVDSEKPIS